MDVVYESGGQVVTVNPSLLVIACDPRGLASVMDYTPQELGIFAALQNFTFYTTCLRVYPKRVQDRIVILSPAVTEAMVGDVQGYRNETGKQWGLTTANNSATNIVTIYQLVAAGPTPPAKGLEAKRKAFLDNPPSWWPFQPGRYEIVSVNENQNGAVHPATNPLFTPYFDQFSAASLAAGYPWKWLDLQGRNNTVYVHASTCFESVLHCWSYLNLLLQVNSAIWPVDKAAPIVIIGAGVSGLLFAERAHGLGYTNVTLLEQTNRFAGKTHSLQVPDHGGTTVAELGTCYLSPAYNDMVQALAPYTAGNVRIAVAHGSERGIVVGTAPNETVVDFSDYGLMCAAQSLGVPWPLTDTGWIEVSVALARAATDYVIMRTEIFGSVDQVMPAKQPGNNPYGVFTKTFAQYLDDNHMGVLKGYLMYAYQVQGYGALDKIPAYYGLVWITPDIAWPFGAASGVTAWQRGWEDVWDQLVRQLRLNIKLNTVIRRIRRLPSL